MSNFTQEHREVLKLERNDTADADLKAAIRAALNHIHSLEMCRHEARTMAKAIMAMTRRGGDDD